MTATTTLNVRLDQELRDRLERFAAVTNRPAAFHMREALLAYLEEREWLLGKLEEARADYEGGRVMGGDESRAFMETLMKRETLERVAAELSACPPGD